MGFLQLFSDYDWVYHHSLDRHPDPDAYDIHTHVQCEILYVLSGCGRFYVEGRDYSVHPGMIFITRRGERHRIEAHADMPYERMVFLFYKEQILRFDPQGLLLKPFYDRPAGSGNAYTDAVFRQPSMVIRHQPYNASPKELRLFAISQVFSFLCELYSAFVSRQADSADLVHKRLAIQPALQYIQEHLFDKLTLDEVGSHSYIGVSQLSKLFKEVMGTSVYEYIIVKRLTAAKFKMDSGMSAAQAAQESGFNTYSAFYRAYLKRFGKAPTAGKKTV